MISPKDMRIIQIDVTNACIHRCSNCTRFCGHHNHPFYMDLQTFKIAVDSLKGYVGTVGIMGGEPTLNPNFEQMVDYIGKSRSGIKTNELMYPQVNFIDAIHELECVHTFAYPKGNTVRQTVNGSGLWSCIGERYKKYYEIIQDNIQYQALNDHSNAMYHQPALISRRSLGIADEDWIYLRDKCWVQNLWSASITPKGAFFCEVAGALDMLFNGPGGWKIEPDWWKRKPEDFGEQLKWCELCGLALSTFTRNANDEIDDVSEDLYIKLKAIGSNKIRSKLINVVKIDNGEISKESKPLISRRYTESMPYTESYIARFDEHKSNLYYKKFHALWILEKEDQIQNIVDGLNNFKKNIVYCDQYLMDKIKLLLVDKLIQLNDQYIEFINNKNQIIGQALYYCLKKIDYHTYLMVIQGNIRIKNVCDRLKEVVLNPGALLFYSNINEFENNEYYFAEKNSSILLLNPNANSLKNIGWDNLQKIDSLNKLKDRWQTHKVIEFLPTMEHKAPSSKIEKDLRYLIFGAGKGGTKAKYKILDAGGSVTGFIDSDIKKQGIELDGIKVYSPEILSKKGLLFDKVVISTGAIYYNEIKKILVERGLVNSEIIWCF